MSSNITGNISILGYHAPRAKQLYISLCSVYGIGKFRAYQICEKLSLDPLSRTHLYGPDVITKIERFIQDNYQIGSELHKKIRNDIRALIDAKIYRGKRRMMGLPVRGQNTRKNRKTARKLNKIQS